MPSHDPSVDHEPHRSTGPAEPDEREAKAARIVAGESARQPLDEYAEHTVWDEPSTSAELTGPDPGGRLTYARWLAHRASETSTSKTWAVTLLVALAAGPWGVLGALMTSVLGGGGWGWMGIAIVAPVAEEMMKIAAALWVAERRPFWFRSPLQILICAVAGGLAFAAIENLLYLLVYIPHHSFDLALWRWSVCVGLHVTCSVLAGIGLVRMWSRGMAKQTRPKIADAAPLIIAAMVGHGLYNAAAIVAEQAGWLKF